MPLRLNVGVSKKLGLPEYSSIGASCHLEVELDASLLHDLDGLHHQVRDAFVAARQAVNDELTRLKAQAQRTALPAEPSPQALEPPARSGKPATQGQIRVIESIAQRRHLDLDSYLCDLGVTDPGDLTITQASQLIDRLKSARPD